MDGLVLALEQGTMQGDPLAMPMYALATHCVGDSLNIVQVWYADDASAAGTFHESGPGEGASSRHIHTQENQL